jgi:hypothetical protein
MSGSPPASPGTLDIALSRKALDQAGITTEQRVALLAQLKKLFTSDETTLDLTGSDLAPWISFFTLVSCSLQSADVSAHNSKDIVEPEEDVPSEQIAPDFDEEPVESDGNEIINVPMPKKLLPLWNKFKKEAGVAPAEEEDAADGGLPPMDTDFVIDEVVEAD